METIKEFMSKPVFGTLSIGLILAGVVAVMLYKRYS